MSLLDILVLGNTGGHLVSKKLRQEPPTEFKAKHQLGTCNISLEGNSDDPRQI